MGGTSVSVKTSMRSLVAHGLLVRQGVPCEVRQAGLGCGRVGFIWKGGRSQAFKS